MSQDLEQPYMGRQHVRRIASGSNHLPAGANSATGRARGERPPPICPFRTSVWRTLFTPKTHTGKFTENTCPRLRSYVHFFHLNFKLWQSLQQHRGNRGRHRSCDSTKSPRRQRRCSSANSSTHYWREGPHWHVMIETAEADGTLTPDTGSLSRPAAIPWR